MEQGKTNCFGRMLFALFAVHTANLSKIAVEFDSKAQVDSHYKRLHRFFNEFKIDYTNIARWVFKLFPATHKIYFTVDKTNWFGEKAKINVTIYHN